MTHSSSDIPWPPLYTVKKHRLAKHVKLRAKASGLEITVPSRFSLKNIPNILEENKSWIIKQILSGTPVKKNQDLPDNIILNALEESWKIEYAACDSKFEMIVRPNKEIVLIGKIEDRLTCKNTLIAWVKKLAKVYLSVELESLSLACCLPFTTLTIRDQQTLWGSCTVKKGISLNYKLIFLPQHLVRHVIIHELCHTEFLNHSEKFWNKVEEFDPKWRIHKSELRRANQYVPDWVS